MRSVAQFMRIPAGRLFFGVALFSMALCSDLSAATCQPPPTLAARLKSHPTPQTWSDLGNWFGERSQFDCAAEAFRSALRLAPSDAKLNYLLGLALYQSQRYDEAIPPLRKSTAADPGQLPTHLLLGSSLSRTGQLPEAEEQWRAALRIDPSSQMALHGLAEALLREQDYGAVIELLHDAHLDDTLTVDLATAYGNGGQLDDAIAVVTRAMETSSSPALSVTLVTLYIKESRSDDAERAAQKAYAQHPDSFAVQIAYMKTLVLNGDWAPARPLGKKLLLEKPHDFDVLYANGVLERQDNEFEAARDHLTEAADLNPRASDVFYNLGVAFARLHNPRNAIEPLRKAIALGDKQPEVHFELANALRATGDTDGARQEMAAYQQAVKDGENYTLAVSKTKEADGDLAKGDLELAIQRYREGFQAFPKYTLAGYKLALALDKAGQSDEERSVLQQVVTTDPGFAAALYQLGYLESRSGDNASAEQHFRQAVSAAPAYTQAWISLAATLGMESKFPAAQEALATALHLDPRNAEARELSHELTVAQNQQSHN